MKVRITSLAGLAGSQAPAWEPLPIKLLLVRLPFLGKQELQNTVLPSWSSHCYTQVLEARHSGRDCRNPVHREVKLRAGNYQNQTLAYRRVCPPWLLDSGNPCRNDDVSCLVGLVYNVESWRLGTG